MNSPQLRIAYLTSGAAGMYCGSCMRDNTLAKALSRLGVDVQLIPTYTPIRTDEEDVTVDQVFYGGINVYLQQKIPLFRYLPSMVDRMFDRPWLIRWATSRGIQTNAKQLGALTVSMLRGTEGNQKKEVYRLVDWLVRDAQPNLVNLSNILIAGMVPALRKAITDPILVTLQGDDIFLDDLPEPYRSQAFKEISRLIESIDGFLVFSNFYADYMADYFSIPREKIHVVPLGIETQEKSSDESIEENKPREKQSPPTIGYLARLAPEKGLHILIDAFIQLRKMDHLHNAQLHIAGWLGKSNKAYVDEQFDKLRSAGLANAYYYAGTVDRQGKLDFLQDLDVLSVPTIYREPKGLFVLESLAAGVPVVQPEHGAFPEMLNATGGGRLVRPGDSRHLAETLAELLTDEDARRALGRRGQQCVKRQFDAESMAKKTLAMYQKFLTR